MHEELRRFRQLALQIWNSVLRIFKRLYVREFKLRKLVARDISSLFERFECARNLMPHERVATAGLSVVRRNLAKQPNQLWSFDALPFEMRHMECGARSIHGYKLINESV